MDKNVDQCSAVEYTAAHSRLTKSREEEKILVVSFFIGAYISIDQEIWCLPYAGLKKNINRKETGKNTYTN